ncbi:MAG: aminotransferase class I/II-fold pyridoxal phosphate-dependent enzyme [Pseudoxanthomonas sp.]
MSVGELAAQDTKISFRNDYSEGAHPRLLHALVQIGNEQNAGYGLDRHSERAAALIRKQIASSDADVHFLAGGTQTNLVAMAAFLRPHEAVIAADSGHVATHEAGAIEATGHKVLTVQAADGKLSPERVARVLGEHSTEHMVRPRLVYLSNTTEMGTTYSKAELTALRVLCDQHRLYLYLDGARIGAALVADGSDLGLADVAALTDAFYIGGTKNGALLGEALVIVREALKPDVRFIIKQRGAMLAKGMVIGAQFEALFRDGLFFDLAIHADAQAQRLRGALIEAGIAFAFDSPSNQLFPILPTQVMEQLEEKYEFHRWQPHCDGHHVIRLVTSWATNELAVQAFCDDLRRLLAVPSKD